MMEKIERLENRSEKLEVENGRLKEELQRALLQAPDPQIVAQSERNVRPRREQVRQHGTVAARSRVRRVLPRSIGTGRRQSRRN